MRSRIAAAIAVAGALALAPFGAAAQSTTCSSFEAAPIPLCADEATFPGVPSGDFSIGLAPRTASFEDGQVMRVGIGAYYHSGVRSWHIPPSTTATILFETPAAEIELWFRDTAGAGPSVVRVINTDEVVILTSNPGGQGFQQVGVNNLPPGPLIDRIEIENSGASGDVVVDDVSYVAPEPGASGVVTTALAALALLAQRRRSGSLG